MSFRHRSWCQIASHSEAAIRMTDTYNLHRIAGGNDSIGKWFAAALQDGRTDNVLYPTKVECVRHQKHNEQYYTYVKIVPPSMTRCEGEVLLTTARRLYTNGFRVADPDHKHGGLEVIKRLTVEDQINAMRGMVTNLQMPGRSQR